MKKALVIAVSAVILFSGCGSSGTQSDAPTEASTEAVEENVAENKAEIQDTEETSSTEKPAEQEEKYVDDEVVNAFIAEYNAISESPFDDVTKGNIRTKFFVHSYGYYLELLHANDTDNINVTITETNDTADAGVSGMRDVFHDCVAVIDKNVSDDEIYEFFDSLVSQEYMAEDTIGDVAVKYFPDKELSSGHSRGHIELKAPEK